jgi:hypothetical protein
MINKIPRALYPYIAAFSVLFTLMFCVHTEKKPIPEFVNEYPPIISERNYLISNPVNALLYPLENARQEAEQRIKSYKRQNISPDTSQ